MTSRIAVLLVLLSCASALGASSDARPELDDLLAMLRLRYPGAVVSGRFYDWRAASQYRTVPGLHLGYDIAMPAGTRVAAAWPGQVVRVARWLGGEFGITVASPSGYETTYGHLSPTVREGDVINAGDTVRTAVHDHVDVKMRGPDGTFYDFGHSQPQAVGLPPPRPTRAGALQAWKLARAAALRDVADIGRTQEELAAAEAARREAAAATGRLPDMRRLAAAGSVSRHDLARAEAEAARCDALARQLAAIREALTAQREHLQAMQASVAEAERLLASLGVTTAELSRLRATPRSPAPARLSADDAARRQAARAHASEMQRLFDIGAVSRAERDRAVDAFKRFGR